MALQCTTLTGNLNFLRGGIADDQRVDTEKLTNFTQNKDAAEASNFLAGAMDFVGKSHHDSDQYLAQVAASSSVGFERDKQFTAILSDHIDEETRMQLPSFVTDGCRGEEGNAVLDPVCNFFVFHNLNAMQESCGIGNLGSSFLNQLNFQPDQQDQRTESAKDDVSQLQNVLSYPTEQRKDEEFLELVLTSSPYEDVQNIGGV